MMYALHTMYTFSMLQINKIHQRDCMVLIKQIRDNSVDMILCDLPYGISKDSGYVNNSPDKIDYIKKYGKHTIDFGEWDTKDIDLNELSFEYFRILKKGGVVVLFYDIWSSANIKQSFNQFNQFRILEWIKTNPVPINSKLNFLSNAKEYMFSFVKSGKPIFNSKYHNGVFTFPLCHGKERTIHRTQKPLLLFEELIKIYTNEGDLVLDNCIGSGTTAVACKKLNRNFIGIEISDEYCKIAEQRLRETNTPLILVKKDATSNI